MLFPGESASGHGQRQGAGLHRPAAVLNVKATLETNARGCKIKTKPTRIPGKELFPKSVMILSSSKIRWCCLTVLGERGGVKLPQPKPHSTHHILLGCVFVALQDTDSVLVAHVLYLRHRVVSKFLQGRNRSLLFL